MMNEVIDSESDSPEQMLKLRVKAINWVMTWNDGKFFVTNSVEINQQVS